MDVCSVTSDGKTLHIHVMCCCRSDFRYMYSNKCGEEQHYCERGFLTEKKKRQVHALEHKDVYSSHLA